MTSTCGSIGLTERAAGTTKFLTCEQALISDAVGSEPFQFCGMAPPRGSSTTPASECRLRYGFSKQVGWVERERNPSSFAGLDDFIASSASPIDRIGTEPNRAAKRGIRPVLHADCVTVLHRIEVNVSEVPRKIVLVAQRVFPIAPLPNPALPFGAAAGGYSFASRQSMGKAAFDQTPTGGEIRVAVGQGPYRMEVIG
jgi:hypothetical protein